MHGGTSAAAGWPARAEFLGETIAMARRLADDGSKQGDLMLRLLEEVESQERLTQRSLSDSLGIALGLTNAYLKRCVRKGWVKISRVPSSRYRYFLTPKGFSEKARLTASYLAGSLKYITTLRRQLDAGYARCEALGQRRVAIVGAGELAELAVLFATARDVEVTGVVDPAVLGGGRGSAGTSPLPKELATADAVIVVDIAASEKLSTALRARFATSNIHRPALLSGDSGGNTIL